MYHRGLYSYIPVIYWLSKKMGNNELVKPIWRISELFIGYCVDLFWRDAGPEFHGQNRVIDFVTL